MEKRAEQAERLAERLGVVESQMADAKKAKEESDKRPWQFVYLGAAAVLALVGGLISAAIQYAFKKS